MTNNSTRSAQTGGVLFVSLIMLLLMTVMVISGSGASYLELMMGTNSQNATEALLRAEQSTLRGEQRIIANFNGAPTVDFSASSTDGLYLDSQININTIDWAAIHSESEGAGADVRQYVIEYIGAVPASGGSLGLGAGAGASMRYLYRVSGRGTSSRASARVVQTIFATTE
ncbi:MAG TPA: hypothetical protein VMU03_05420 [Gammaproteobacteria bacterium]|jgi:Tfp pilus assembly protein PilX|nr:hypothetical protein [Gammaproteobacteria bacterium]